jgi:hypothetical protein
MGFLYRAAITITRKQPYVDWANSLEDGGPLLTSDLATDSRTVYLVAESDEGPPDLQAHLAEQWEDIFESELDFWTDEEDDWPAPRTREMFDAWFDAEITDAVIDLIPNEPLTQTEVDILELGTALHHCASCGIEVDEAAGRFAGFKLANPERFAHRQGLTLPIPVDEEQVIVGMLPPADSDEARAGHDLVFRVCSSACERAVRAVVPKALRKITGRV